MQRKHILQLICLSLWIAAGSAPKAATEEVTVLLDWFINPDHAPLIVAEQEGLFENAGLKVNLVEPTDPSLPPKLAAAKKADLAISYQPSLMVDLNNSLPLMRVGTIVNSPLNSLVVLADSDILSIKNLKGKTVGFSVGGFDDAVLGAMLETHGLTLGDVKLVNVNFALSPSLYAGQVDAVIGAFRNFELNQMDIDGRPGRAFYPEEHGVPAYEELIFVTHPDYAGTAKIERFLDIMDQATELILQSSDAMYQSFISYRPADLDNELNRRAWTDTLPKLARKTRQIDSNQWERFAQFMIDRGLIQKPPSTATYLFQSGG
ncbi:MAG: ABC transporter substrate-binding protein [Pseudomonadota bacterium]|nr:ABC transporter substrate-binding protein [Pseudomonadota bacterium]